MPKDNPNEYPTRKLQEHNGQYNITLPKHIVEAKGWRKGKEITVRLDTDGDIRITD